jgi:hypothetical protein
MALSVSGVLASALFDLPDGMRQTLPLVLSTALLVSGFTVLAGCLGELSNCWS